MDAIVGVRFLTVEEGGCNAAVEGIFYACLLLVDNEAFDCRIVLDDRRLELGKDYEVPVRFLYRELPLSKLAVGKEIWLWEGRKVASGRVVSFSVN
ncbi:hypothetical protein E5C33_05720 [Stenotrophomonas maltophilia]|uniref:hypothetical protein n=1 Tax=Stenotrophomonas maltophilia TaxID=40324 RepID=UPI001076405D|nr:hypothetical protein [Stenotrophomonas maltophilia]TFZ46693.1 hypothetical protein E5C33_05720 [Stenotrophomonas maltophilia]